MKEVVIGKDLFGVFQIKTPKGWVNSCEFGLRDSELNHYLLGCKEGVSVSYPLKGYPTGFTDSELPEYEVWWELIDDRGSITKEEFLLDYSTLLHTIISTRISGRPALGLEEFMSSFLGLIKNTEKDVRFVYGLTSS